MRVIVHPCLDLGTPDAGRIEVVERKGAGHPDTLCDGLAERLSAALSRHYLERFGEILHHNVDKALLVGGVARPELGGGEIIEPIEITLAGRAVRNVGADRIPIEEIAIEESRRFIRETFRELDPERHVKIQCRIRPGSLELSELFARRTGTRWLANDTSCGVGFSPLSPLEALVLELDRDLASSELRDAQPWSGEDLKLMATRIDQSVELAIARAMIGRHLRSLDE